MSLRIILIISFVSAVLYNPLFLRVCRADPSGDNRDTGTEITGREKEYYRIGSKDYWRGYFSDTKNIVTSPVRWEKKDWITFTAVTGITVGLYAADQEITDWVQENRNDISDETSAFFERFGNGKYTLPPLAILYAYGHYRDHEKSRRVALLSLESFAITGVFTQVLKFSTHRHRPNSGDGYNTWDGPGLESDNLSFPSGHSSSVFSIATVIATEYRDKSIVPPVAYGIATLSALSRVHDNKHWTSDIFVGSSLGYFTAKAVVSLHEKHEKKRLSLYPVIENCCTAIMASYRY